MHEFFRSATIEKKKQLRIQNKAHKAPITTTIPLRTPYIVSLHALVKSLLELAISSGKNGSRARNMEPKVHHLLYISVNGPAG